MRLDHLILSSSGLHPQEAVASDHKIAVRRDGGQVDGQVDRYVATNHQSQRVIRRTRIESAHFSISTARASNVFPGGNSEEATPVPIPNTEVKLSRADGTAGATLWESRSLPGSFRTARF